MAQGQSQKLPGLQAARCYAASAIIIFHMVALPNLAIPSYLGFIPSHFAFGVPLFYILSAFALMVGYRDRLSTTAELKDYFLRRFLRIAPLFYFVMIFYVGFLWFASKSVVSPAQFLTSALFIFNVVPQHVQGFVMASWSVGIEMVFYALLPLLMLFANRLISSIALLMIAVFIAGEWSVAFKGTTGDLASFSNYSFLAQAYYFAFGIVAFYVWRRLPKAPLLGAGLLAASAVGMVALVQFALPLLYFYGPIVGWDYGSLAARATWGAVLATGVIGIAMLPVRVLVNRVSLALGEASFSLYLWHPVVIVLLTRAGIYTRLYGISSSPLVGFLCCLVVTFAVIAPVALLSYRYIERPGMSLGRLRITTRPVAPATPEPAQPL